MAQLDTTEQKSQTESKYQPYQREEPNPWKQTYQKETIFTAVAKQPTMCATSAPLSLTHCVLPRLFSTLIGAATGEFSPPPKKDLPCTCFLMGGAAFTQLLNSRHRLETSGYKAVALFCKGLPSGRDCSTLSSA